MVSQATCTIGLLITCVVVLSVSLSMVSGWSEVTSGVPQGSILGPMLFLLFINDLLDVISSSTSTGLYADDTKLYKAITSHEDCDHLQEALSYADGWNEQSNIDFNASKCKILTISRRIIPIEAKYYLCSTKLMREQVYSSHLSLIVLFPFGT